MRCFLMQTDSMHRQVCLEYSGKSVNCFEQVGGRVEAVIRVSLCWAMSAVACKSPDTLLMIHHAEDQSLVALP